MAVIRNVAQPAWRAECWGFSGTSERNVRDLSHASVLVFAVAALVAGILAGISLTLDFGTGVTSSFIVVTVLFPLACGWLVRERWRTRKLEARIKSGLGLANGVLAYDNSIPARLVIVFPALRVHSADQARLQGAFQESREVPGWKIRDVLSAEGFEDQANSLLKRTDPAASCCFDTLVRAGLGGEWPVRITMARITPQQGESRILVLVEDLHQGRSQQPRLSVEGYVC